MNRHSRLVLVLSALTALLLSPQVAQAAPFDNQPKILAHVRTVINKNPCAGANALGDCQNAVTEGPLDASRFVYVLAARGSVANLGAVQFGIRYQDNCPGNILDGQRIDIFSWTRCGALEFVTPTPLWPRSGSGNLITWDVTSNCQAGEFGVAGYFYMACYGAADVLYLTPRPGDNLAKVVDCGSIETIVPQASLGRVAFSSGAATPGCNPCDGPCPALPADPGCSTVDNVWPADVDDLVVTGSTDTEITLQWTATGDDGYLGRATSYDLRASTEIIDNDNFATSASIATAGPALSGQVETKTVGGLSPGTTYYFAIKVVDEVGNTSAISNVPFGTTSGDPAADATPPGAINDLTVQATAADEIRLRWTAPHEDGPFGGAVTSLDVRRSTAPITAGNFAAATALGGPAPGTPGAEQVFTAAGLAPNTLYYFAVKSTDDVGLVSAISNVASTTTPAASPSNSDATFFLHLTPPVGGNRCGNGALTDCRDAVTAGDLLPARYFAYLMVGGFDEIQGMQLGITYDDGQASGRNDHDKLDIASWTLCATLEFSSPSPAWPAPQSGNLITWDAVNACQRGPTAVAGFFYLSAYGPDELRLIPRPVDGLAKVADCGSAETPLFPEDLGSARFSAGAAQRGNNPCSGGSPVAIRPTSWSRIKVLASEGVRIRR
jgi:hypothetical protein